MYFKKYIVGALIFLSMFIIVNSISNKEDNKEDNNNNNNNNNIIEEKQKNSYAIEKPIDEVINTDKIEEKKNINLLILGTDESEKRSDVIIIASLNFKKKEINMLSIPRDTKVIINNRNRKINAALALKDEEYVVSMVEEITSIPISFYAVMNFKGFKNIVDIIGGVDFNVPRNMYYNDPYQNLNINLKKGMQYLDGEKAHQLVRFRKYEDGDIGRIKVQQKFIKAFLAKLISMKNITKINSIIYEIMDNTKTDVKFSDIIKNINAIGIIKSENIKMFSLQGESKMVNGVSYYIYNVEKSKELIEENF